MHADQWKINGCPANGPQLDARGGAVGRVDVLMLEDGSVLVTWIEGVNAKRRHLRPPRAPEWPR